MEAIWSADWMSALDAACRVIDCLSGGRSSSRYSALWNYLAMSIAVRLHLSTGTAQYTSSAAVARVSRSASTTGLLFDVGFQHRSWTPSPSPQQPHRSHQPHPLESLI